MRWIKHLSMAHNDKAMSSVLEDLGPDAYGVYWLIVENIASVMEKGKMSPELVCSELRWAQLTHCSVRRFRTIAQRLNAERLIVYQSADNRIIISVPKILKYKDEYTKKSGHSPDSKADTEGKTEGEGKKTPDDPIPVDLKKPKLVLVPSAGKTELHTQDPKFDVWAEAKYAAHPKKTSKFEALKALADRFYGRPEEQAVFDRNHAAWCKTREWRKSRGSFAPKLHDFVPDDGWMYPPPEELEEPVSGRSVGNLALKKQPEYPDL